jgi:hypothetical protein
MTERCRYSPAFAFRAGAAKKAPLTGSVRALRWANGPSLIENCEPQNMGRGTMPPRRNASSFVVLLYAMMTNPALASLCGFAPNGQSFYVTSSKEFHETVLPQVRS